MLCDNITQVTGTKRSGIRTAASEGPPEVRIDESELAAPQRNRHPGVSERQGTSGVRAETDLLSGASDRAKSLGRSAAGFQRASERSNAVIIFVWSLTFRRPCDLAGVNRSWKPPKTGCPGSPGWFSETGPAQVLNINREKRVVHVVRSTSYIG